jgi:hypothetical protein
MSRGGGNYGAALNAPFSTQALGAQIPDIFSYPTETKHFRASFTVTPNYQGNGEFVIMPSPLFSIMSAAQIIDSTTTVPSDIIAGGVHTVSSTGAAGIPAGDVYTGGTGKLNTMDVHSCTDLASISSVFTQFRVVGWGYKIRAIGISQNVSGRLQLAAIPAPRWMPNLALYAPSLGITPNQMAWGQYDAYTALFGIASGVTTRAAVAALYPVPNLAQNITGFSGRILDFPYNCEVTGVQLQNVPVRGHGKLVTREFESFRESQQLVGAEAFDAASGVVLLEGYQAFNPSASLIPLNANPNQVSSNGAQNLLGPNSMLGWNCVLVNMAGFATGAGGSGGTFGVPSQLEIELIYHVEGIEPIGVGQSGGVILPLGGRQGGADPVAAMAAEAINSRSGMLILAS